jgi:hypothetical protein
MLTRPEASPIAEAASPTPAEMLQVRSAAGLDGILAVERTLALWHRLPPAGLRREADRMAAQPPFCVTAEGEPARLVSALGPTLTGRAPRLVADIVRLARLFARVTGHRAVHARLEALTDDGCALFHADEVGIRLLCTYAGAGTEWVPGAGARRAGLGRGDNALVVPDRTAIRHLPRFAVGLFKGEAYPGNRGRGVVHRSPPASPGRPRLLLCLDEPGRF